jgi:carbonic anhydrase
MSDICHDCGHVDGEPGMSRWLVSMFMIVAAFAVAAAFACRNAGNISPPTEIASLEYAVDKLKVPVIVVMGHEVCGAVEATLDLVQKRRSLGDNLNEMAAYILPAVNNPKAKDLKSAVERNAHISAEGLTRRSDLLAEKVKRRKLLICVAYFHLSSPNPGRVEWLGKCKCPTPAR